ncbi:MAG: glycoside hydrolase family 127 protein [Oscillospiraceae bacterium]|jgi:DUF1680 family protein|nr:glycoside hydrolase family 127 protein [Oscillospiraceae bacterium]
MHDIGADLRTTCFDGGFWGPRIELMRDKALRYQWEILNDRVPGAEPSGCVRNFRIAAGIEQGAYTGMVFQDSDLGKWLEAVGYALQTKPDDELERIADEVIELIERAQQPDGYLNTYYTIKEPGRRWTNIRDNHELYCAGHMMEAAVAYYEATGKRRLLDVMLRMAYHIDSVIGPEAGKKHAFPGHEEIELALVKMYRVTGDAVLLKLADYFLRARGLADNYFICEHPVDAAKTASGAFDGRYWQNHKPVVDQEALVGHAVRALYMATGMAEVAAQTGASDLFGACAKLFDDLVGKRMYITGGVGSNAWGEAFSTDYDLPSDRAYAETCASIALCFFARALLRTRPEGRFADAMERALYNTCLAGVALDGEHFFYVNPLEVWPQVVRDRRDAAHVLAIRPGWFSCACCPPNLVRLLLSLGKYAYGAQGSSIYCHLYINGRATLKLPDSTTDLSSVTLSVETDYPYGDTIVIRPSAGTYALMLRIPEWSAKRYSITVNQREVDARAENGYACIKREFADGDTIRLKLDLSPRRTYANPCLRDANGKVAVERGPLVYCLEEADNGEGLNRKILPDNVELVAVDMPDKLGGIVGITAKGLCELPGSTLYGGSRPELAPCELGFIPYYTWANRGENEMRVWVRSQER